MPILKNHPTQLAQRKILRRNLTGPEQKLWYFLRGNRMDGWKFRRQYGMLNYILDFYCVSAKLAIEIDGDSHYESNALEYDAKRTTELGHFGIRVLRFTNSEINNNIEGVLETIYEHLT